MTEQAHRERLAEEEHPGRDAAADLFRTYAATRDPSVREQLIVLHLGLVSRLARRLAARAEDLDDLIQVGYIGLIKAIDRFEPERGYKFITYAVPTVDGEMRRYIRDKCGIIRIPRHLQELRFSVDRVAEQLVQQLGRRASVEEVAKALDVEPQQVESALGCQLASPVSLDRPDPDAESATLLNEVGRENEELRRFEERLILERAIQGLSPRQRAILYLLFYEDLSQAEIGERLNISQMHVSRLSRAAIERLREGLTVEDHGTPQKE